MQDTHLLDYIEKVITNMPPAWLQLTTHRLDIYEESLAKTQFLDRFAELYQARQADTAALEKLPTAYDYIRLGHPLSSVLEWTIAKINRLPAENLICFASNTAPILAILRKNLLDKKNTRILYTEALPPTFDAQLIREVYGYHFELEKCDTPASLPEFDGSTILLSHDPEIGRLPLAPQLDFVITLYGSLGSIIAVQGEKNQAYIPEIQHVRRRETIAMTPAHCLMALKALVAQRPVLPPHPNAEAKRKVLDTVKNITAAPTAPLVASSGLSIQYAIMMGLIHHALQEHPGQPIQFLVPPNCYGGTNDQARRVAACLEQVSIVDLPVDGENEMVRSIDTALEKAAAAAAVPYIIAEIPTNPRVEVPDLQALKAVLGKTRHTAAGQPAIEPVFILDQTFCPNYRFLGEGDILSTVRAISYVSGSKFPSGGRCTAGYAVGNRLTHELMDKIAVHLTLCDNEATPLQYEILAQQLPSMNQRIREAYENTREFVNFIRETLPEAKINFVSEQLAAQGFTPSVFSLDLPTKGNTAEEREAYKRALNLKLIKLMIAEIPKESKYCVSYGQLKGCYWTIPATSTQGTTQEGDKDYIVRASLSGNMDLDRHKKVFLKFVEGL